MVRKKKADPKRPIASYEHTDKKRVNNPPVGLVTPGTDPDAGQRQTYAYDPHLDPQLVWAGKAEHTSFEVPTVSLHVHERIDPRTIIEAVRKRNGGGKEQGWLFDMMEENPPLREAVEFYKHAHGWSNRLVAGDSLLVMNSLLEKEGMAGKVQMIFNDPPYGIKYGSNFQPFVNKRDVKDGKDEDLTTEPEQIRAFRDTWELGIHSYLTYLRDRLLLDRELLTESGSVFVQISDENVHHVRELMDEVFGVGNFVAIIPFRKKTMPLGAKFIESMYDYLLWYGKDKKLTKYHALYEPQSVEGDFHWAWYELPDGTRMKMTKEQVSDHSLVPEKTRIFRLVSMWPASFSEAAVFDVEYKGQIVRPPKGQCWPTSEQGMRNIIESGRVHMEGNNLRRSVYLDEYSHTKIIGLWSDTTGARDQNYVVETSHKVIQRCLLMTTDPGDLVFDPTCGSGTTAYVAEQWGRRWITCDTSRVALTLAKQRLMTAVYDYYDLAHPKEGVGSGFKYKTVPHITLKSIANNEPPATETLYDQPLVDRKKHRVSGPFTVEAVPAPAVKAVEEILESAPQTADASIARFGETLRQGEWRDELLRTGIRGKAGQSIRFARLEPLPGCRWLHADGETRPSAEGADSVREKGTA
ncbi:MAG: site-specific DNA-methyltransferase, partial [Deltaproteobacteria bacterium]